MLTSFVPISFKYNQSGTKWKLCKLLRVCTSDFLHRALLLNFYVFCRVYKPSQLNFFTTSRRSNFPLPYVLAFQIFYKLSSVENCPLQKSHFYVFLFVLPLIHFGRLFHSLRIIFDSQIAFTYFSTLILQSKYHSLSSSMNIDTHFSRL